MRTIFLSILLMFISANASAQKQKLDSLIIEASKDPGSGPDFYFIKIYFGEKDFLVKYELYDGFDKNSYVNDSDLEKIRNEFKSNNENITDSIRYKLERIRSRHTKFYVKQINLKNKKYKRYLSELNHVAILSQNDIENQKNKKASYFHGVMFCFDFYSGSVKKRLCGSALEKDNFATLYHFLTNTLDLYRKRNKDEIFNDKTFGY